VGRNDVRYIKKGTPAQEFQWENRKGLKSSVYSMYMLRFFIQKNKAASKKLTARFIRGEFS
ncbi:hypothetical protein ACUOA8_43315, partial [Escherichia sp. SS-MK2]